MIKPGRISAEEMARFNMRPTHDERYRLANLIRSELEYGKAYAEDVKRYMDEIKRKQKRTK